jgi:hypothetical protein
VASSAEVEAIPLGDEIASPKCRQQGEGKEASLRCGQQHGWNDTRDEWYRMIN